MDVLLRYGFSVFGESVSYAEFVGQICALAVVLLARRRTMWTWPVQIAATILLFVVYSSAHLGGLACRQVVTLAISCYGWWAWVRRRDPAFGVVVRKATGRERLALAAVLLIGWVGAALAFTALGPSWSWSPWPDAWIFVGGLVAFAAQGLGLVEFWVIWLLVDAVGVPLQLSTGLFFSALVYVVFAVLVIRGLVDWLRTARRTAGRLQRTATAAG